MGREFDGTHRTTFVIEADGTIGRIIAKPKVKAHAEEILQTEGDARRRSLISPSWTKRSPLRKSFTE